MLSPPDNLRDADIHAALAEHWDASHRELTYHPVGFGSHHWLTEAHFISVDRAADASSLTAALRTAAALRNDAGLEFVVDPIPTESGSLLVPISDDWVMHVYPRLAITGPTRHGPHTDPQVVELVQAIHDATPLVGQYAQREDFSIAHRAELEEALGDLDGRWTAGPYGEQTRRLLIENAENVERLFDAHDHLASDASHEDWVVTHGEPHQGNIFQTTRGWVVVDWDTALLAPPARDLWDLPVDCDAGLRQLYRLRWDLAEIAIYVAGFHNAHTGDLNDQQAWAGLLTYIDAQARWPEVL